MKHKFQKFALHKLHAGLKAGVFRSKKSFGQNFLKNPRIIEKIISAAELKGHETVLEVGPGFGSLTEGLLRHAAHVMAIEKDNYLYDFLLKKFADEIRPHGGTPKLTLIRGDALKIQPPKNPYVWISNIPYSITSPLLDHFIRQCPYSLPARAVLLLQKEVAEKICAAPPRMNVLALHVQTFGAPKKIAVVSRNNFDPRPKVDSAIIRIDFPKKDPPKNLSRYFDLIHTAFSKKRKMLRATLSTKVLQEAAIDPARRPETLTAKEWEAASDSLTF